MNDGDNELRGVRLGDVYRDKDGALWEVTGLCDLPQAIVTRIGTVREALRLPGPFGDATVRLADREPVQEHHVIGCPNWQEKWQEGPLRPEGEQT